jgi:glucosamine--fructose-6-phosphate aminotransferase (isomerizing)
MLAGIAAQPEFLRDGAARAFHALAQALPLRVPSRVYLVGCGDSHYAGMATRFAFERWSGIPTEAIESLEFARYAIEDARSDALVVAVSKSGRVVRTVECARLAHQRGIPSIALTHYPGSPLAHAASMLLPCTYADVGPGPGTLSYVASLVGLYALAVRLGELNQRLDKAATSATLEALTVIGENATTTIQASRDSAALVAANLPTQGLISVLGGGPNYATALFGTALFIEAAGYPATGVELEEWSHEQFWCTGPGTATLVVAPPGASVDRAREQLQAARDIGGHAVAICAADDTTTSGLADVVVPLVPPADELLSPLVTAIPVELITLAFAQRLGPTVRVFDDKQRRVVHLRQLYGTSDEVLDAGRA